MVKIFETKVTSVGAEADGMIESANMLILFGQGAPADLAEFCYTIDNKILDGHIQEGSTLLINQSNYKVTSIGNVVEKNLINLGHITISFDGSSEGSLPGTLHVIGSEIPKISEGTTIAFFQ
ncbi:PTS system glucitol/sorbitol-specific transporter subunit IIA [Streptococcus dysgalactiae subsp. dysgalactiae]|uniref:PTS system glucitol/sorbitol-specific transporter subunit IIA n=1 Tax=Streptococcus dysgalactiae subsp. dysgalactiae TaxID=99822 RepID=A0A380K0R9_STRDY|nr:PTS glucitol/sorbitol transporter subunit IIA [Streptococcus dysgalactiae]MCB2831313.1 PTS glucitol/sorbitol transporter subunit IIA [Streptococcus dysgalactiae subsp. dysgalactiae]MCB2834354.1 PTS glucitol/sorbitol transporter subunit IIA [Streptococcus dysgalactiae subsp. dysgalactiae]MCB2837018.1 PTS glucitol/sorbitol transporter subunit IIA [Streptococcus dysgalactiae subsp. dysgalactiae]MCB2840160.1 PTS glucitol/sorbitol transporter subunit IIA [Streptococcus dysgalactiae subsp. dysgala